MSIPIDPKLAAPKPAAKIRAASLTRSAGAVPEVAAISASRASCSDGNCNSMLTIPFLGVLVAAANGPAYARAFRITGYRQGSHEEQGSGTIISRVSRRAIPS